jgi:hypothetical protein
MLRQPDKHFSLIIFSRFSLDGPVRKGQNLLLRQGVVKNAGKRSTEHCLIIYVASRIPILHAIKHNPISPTLTFILHLGIKIFNTFSLTFGSHEHVL